MPALGVELKLVQLIAHTDWLETFTYQQGKATPYDYDWMFEAGGRFGEWMQVVRGYTSMTFEIYKSLKKILFRKSSL